VKRKTGKSRAGAYKKTIKGLAGTVFYYGGLFHVVRAVNNILGRRLTVVTYHRVTDRDFACIESSLPYLFVRKDTFEDQILFMKKHYRIMSFKELEGHRKAGAVPWNSLIITFDDGYEDFHHTAYPLLKRHGVPATVFLAVNRVGNASAGTFWWDRAFHCLKALQKEEEGGGQLSELDEEAREIYEEFRDDPSRLFARLNRWEAERLCRLIERLPGGDGEPHGRHVSENMMLTWQQVREMNGEVEVGSHTLSHSNLLGLEGDRRAHEIEGSKKKLERHVSERITAFSYPAGNTDAETKRMVCSAGYEYAVLTKRGVNTLSDRFALKRINIWEGTCPSSKGRVSRGVLSLKLVGF
jgi:peptidoglycan/xylan/chitin deacetylase (PgdA/CDA1 family)